MICHFNPYFNYKNWEWDNLIEMETILSVSQQKHKPQPSEKEKWV